MRIRAKELRSWNGQPPGLILIKSSLAIGICFIIAYITDPLSAAGLNTAFQAGIATILCLKDDAPNTTTEAVNRSIGTILSGFWAYLFILLSLNVAGLGHGSPLFYFTDLIALMILIAFLLFLRRPGAIVCAVVVFLLATMLPVSVANPLSYVLRRIIDTEVGILVALFVNWLPILNKAFQYRFDPALEKEREKEEALRHLKEGSKS